MTGRNPTVPIGHLGSLSRLLACDPLSEPGENLHGLCFETQPTRCNSTTVPHSSVKWALFTVREHRGSERWSGLFKVAQPEVIPEMGLHLRLCDSGPDPMTTSCPCLALPFSLGHVQSLALDLGENWVLSFISRALSGQICLALEVKQNLCPKRNPSLCEDENEGRLEELETEGTTHQSPHCLQSTDSGHAPEANRVAAGQGTEESRTAWDQPTERWRPPPTVGLAA